MTIPYRTQRLLKRILGAFAVIAVVLAVVCACWFLWLQRFVVYTADGKVRLDFNLPPIADGQPAVPPENADIPIRFDQNDEMSGGSAELTQMLGYYVERTDLQDIDAVITQISALPPETAVMVDVKGIKGDFYYSSAISSKRNSTRSKRSWGRPNFPPKRNRKRKYPRCTAGRSCPCLLKYKLRYRTKF